MFINKIKIQLDRISSLNLIVFSLLFLFMLLLARDPFSQRTLIPNFDPYPDAFHYVVPARSFVLGHGFALTREGRSISPSVPPAYSMFLIPFYWIKTDPRMYYLANVVLSLISFFLLTIILKKLTNNKLIIGSSLFLFITNYFIYWYPELAMSENLVLPLFLGGIVLLTNEVSNFNILATCAVSFALYATKYANAPLLISFLILLLIKLLTNTADKSEKIKSIKIYFLGFILVGLLVFSYNLLVSGFNPLSRLIGFLLNAIYATNKTSAQITGQTGEWFSRTYFPSNFINYLKGLTGSSERFVWDFTPVFPRLLSVLALMGLGISLFIKKFRIISLSLLILLFSEVVFISFFYAFDMRYIYHVIPTYVIGLALFWVYLEKILNKRKLNLLFYSLLILFSAIILITSSIRLKKQISLNLKYAEVPWSYISILKLNEYFDSQGNLSTRPIVISSLPPYLIDFYSSGKYDLLPLSKDQEFRNYTTQVWGPNDYSNLINLYKSYLNKGRTVYVDTYGLGNEGNLHLSFDEISNNFKLIEVKNDCYGLCKIYKLNLYEKTSKKN